MTMILRPTGPDNLTRRSVTNSPRNPSDYEDRVPEIPLIDTIRFSGYIHEHRVPHWQMKRTVDLNGEFADRFTTTQVATEDFNLLVRVTHDGMTEAVIERSLPTLEFGHNIEAVDVSTAARLVHGLYDKAAEFVDWAVDVGELRVRRLDLDRDFDGIEHLDHLLRGLARLHVPRTQNASVFSDNEANGGALTLTRGVRGRWRVSLYDKHAQVSYLARCEPDPDRSAWLERRAAETHGRVRFEIQLRNQGLRDEGIHTMSDLKEQKLMGLREHYFHRAQFGTPVGGAPQVEAVMKQLAITHDRDYKFFGPLIGLLMAEAMNLPQPTTSSATLAKYRKLAKEWGLSAADMSGLAGPPVALDYERGTLRAAS
jgi:hypothetical protein